MVQLIISIYSFFTINKNILLKINYTICLTNATKKTNIIDQLFIKYKYIICHISAVKNDTMAHGLDIKKVINAISKKILGFIILFILYIDSISPCNCLIKLDIIPKKQLMSL